MYPCACAHANVCAHVCMCVRAYRVQIPLNRLLVEEILMQKFNDTTNGNMFIAAQAEVRFVCVCVCMSACVRVGM